MATLKFYRLIIIDCDFLMMHSEPSVEEMLKRYQQKMKESIVNFKVKK